MSASRREFLTLSTLSLLRAAAGFGQSATRQPNSAMPDPSTPMDHLQALLPRMGRRSSTRVSAADFESSGKLVNFSLTEADADQAASDRRALWHPATSGG